MYMRLKAFDGKCALRIKKEIFNIRFKAIVDTCAIEIKNNKKSKAFVATCVLQIKIYKRFETRIDIHHNISYFKRCFFL